MGVGGVGSVTAEMLTRCGIGKVTHHLHLLLVLKICSGQHMPVVSLESSK